MNEYNICEFCTISPTISEHSRALTTRVTESGIDHFAAQAKIASILEELQNVLILIVWRIGVIKARAKRSCFSFTGRFSNLWVQFNTKMSFQKLCLTNFVNSSPFSSKYTEILKFTPQRRHESELAAFADFF